jgi:hypothetical protein
VLRRSELDPHVAAIGDAHAALAADLAEFAVFLQGLSAE